MLSLNHKARLPAHVLGVAAGLLILVFLVYLAIFAGLSKSPSQPAVAHLTLDGYSKGARDLLVDARSLLVAESADPDLDGIFMWGLTHNQVVMIAESREPFAEIGDFDRLGEPDLPIYLWKDFKLSIVTRRDLMKPSDLKIVLIEPGRAPDSMGSSPFAVKGGDHNRVFTITCNNTLLKLSGSVAIEAATDNQRSLFSVLSAKGPVRGSQGMIFGGTYHVQGPMYIDCFQYATGKPLGVSTILDDVTIPETAEICWSPAGKWILCYSYAYQDVWLIKRPPN